MTERTVAFRENRSVDGDLDSVFDGIMKIGRVIGKSSKLNPTLRMIEGVMHNYTHSWKRRSLRMIAETEILRRSLAGEVTTVSFLVQVFEWDVTAELALMKASSQNLCKSVTEGIVEIANRMAEMRRPTSAHRQTDDVHGNRRSRTVRTVRNHFQQGQAPWLTCLSDLRSCCAQNAGDLDQMTMLRYRFPRNAIWTFGFTPSGTYYSPMSDPAFDTKTGRRHRTCGGILVTSNRASIAFGQVLGVGL
jgi:hypothetical protein